MNLMKSHIQPAFCLARIFVIPCLLVLTGIHIQSCKPASDITETPKAFSTVCYGERLSGEVLARIEVFHENQAEILLFDLRGDSALYFDTVAVESKTLCFYFADKQNCFTKHGNLLAVNDTKENTAMFDTLYSLSNSLSFLPMEYSFDLNRESQTGNWEKMPTLILVEDNAFSGYTGCNSMFGEYKKHTDSLSFDKIASTRRYCGENNPEKSFLEALRETKHYKRKAGKVSFYDAKDSLLLELKPYR